MSEFRNPAESANRQLEEEMSEQAEWLRRAFADNPANALGVINAELVRIQKVIDGKNPDPRLQTEDEVRKAQYFLAEYTRLKSELEASSTKGATS